MKKIYIYPTVLVVLLLCGIISCKKDNTTNTVDLFVYTPSGTASTNMINGGSLLIVGDKALSTPKSGFPVLLTRAFTTNIEVTASIDTGLVSTYNKENQTKYPSLPAGAFNLETSSVTIKSGETESTDSIKVQSADVTRFMPGTNKYLVPILLNNVTGGASLSSTRQVMYVEVTVVSVATSITDASGKNVVDISLQRNGANTTGTSLINLRANLNAAIPTAVNVAILENAALIAKFNEQNKTTYQAFPVGAFKLQNDNITIEANKTQSTDNLQLQLPDLSLFAAGTDYLLAVQIKENTADGIPSDPAKNVVYVHVSVFVNNIDPTNPSLIGTVMDRTGWSVTTSGSYSGNAVTRVLDGNNATAWDSDGKLPAWIVLDMGSSQTIKGFPIVPSYEYPTDDFINMDVLSSNDGTIWKLEGKYVGTKTGGTATAPDIKTVNFFKPVTARYFKFNITKVTSGSYAGMGELNAVQ